MGLVANLGQQVRTLLLTAAPAVPYTDAGLDTIRRLVARTLQTGGYHSTQDVVVRRNESPLVLAIREPITSPRSAKRVRRARRRITRALLRGWKPPRSVSVDFNATLQTPVHTYRIAGTVRV